MKNLIIFFLCSMTSISANAQYKIDWVNAPLNPILESYNLTQMNIKGKVISREDGITTFNFNNHGFVTDILGFVEEKYSYDANGYIKSRSSSYANSTFQCDNKGRVIKNDMGAGSGIRYFYNAEGLLSKQNELKTGDLVNGYTYDSKGRIINDEYYNEGKLFTTTTYSYNNTGSDLEVKITKTQIGKPASTTTNKYNNRGDCISRDGKPIIYTYDKDNNILTISGTTIPIRYTYTYNNSLIDWDAISQNGCISGDCENGYGTKQFGERIYEGFFTNGKQDGPGIFTKNKEIFMSVSKNGQTSGFGVFLNNETRDSEQGYFDNFLLNGKGYRKINNKYLFGKFASGALVPPHYKVEKTGLSAGCYMGDCAEQYGRFKFSNGDLFMGFFKAGNPEAGIFKDYQGNNYTGEFINGKKEGFGQQDFTNKDSYFGIFKNGKRNGKGLYIKKGTSSQVLMGIWQDDKLLKNLTKIEVNQSSFVPTPSGPGIIKNSTSTSVTTNTSNAGTKQPSFNSTPTPSKTPITDYNVGDLGFGNVAPDLNKTTFRKTLENMYPGYPNKDKKFLAKKIVELAAVKTTDAEKVKFIAEKVEDIIPINKYEAFQVIIYIDQKFQLPVLKYLTPEFRQYVKAEAKKFVNDYYKEHPMR